MKKLFLLMILQIVCSIVKAQFNGYLPAWNYTANGSIFYNHGKVGINTTNPSGLLEINTTSLNTGLIINSDETNNQAPAIINATVSNADFRLYGALNSRYIMKNNTTSTSWYLSNNTATTGIGLDGFAIGTSPNPSLGFLTISSAGTTSLTALALSSVALSAGTSGTIAVKSNIVFPITFEHGSYNPAGSLTVYFGNNNSGTPQTAATWATQAIPIDATITGYDISIFCSTASSAGTSTFNVIAGSSTITLNSTITHTAGTGRQMFSANNLNTNVSAGNALNIQWLTSTATLQPTGVITGVTLWLKGR